MFISKIGIDLGTTNTLVFIPKKGIVIDEPTVVAKAIPENTILSIGKEAKEMVGKTPENIIVYRPLREGVIADYYVTKAMLSYFISHAVGFNIIKPEIVISVSSGITMVEKRAARGAAKEAGAKEVYLVKEPILAALGAGIPINSSAGSMIVNLGGGTSEIAVISLGGMVSFTSEKIGGDNLDKNIADYIRKKYHLIIGEQTAERIKIEIGSALPLKEDKVLKVRGRDSSGLPKDIDFTSSETAEAVNKSLFGIVEAVRKVFNQTPPELIADVMEKGIILSGGTSKLWNIDKYLEQELSIPVFIAEDPYFCVSKGTAIILNHLDRYKRTLLSKI